MRTIDAYNFMEPEYQNRAFILVQLFSLVAKMQKNLYNVEHARIQKGLFYS